MKTVYFLKGLPGSGKTTWAKEMVRKLPNSYKRVNKDDLRAMMDDSVWTSNSEDFILKIRDMIIVKSLEEGRHVFVDDTNLAPKHEARIRQLVHGKANFEIEDFTEVPIETCIERDLRRPNSVGEKVIRKMYNQFLKPKPEKIEEIEGLPSAVICDLDGTLAIHNGRSPYDTELCGADLVNETIKRILLNGLDGNEEVIFVSGREDTFRKHTIRWIKDKVKLVGYSLYMRPEGDTRPDQIVKKEIFDNHIRGKYNIKFVLDDRDRVVRMWRDLGLTCLQVNDGDF